MHEGSVVQTGTPEELFARPAHTFVGYFIGSPGMNVLPRRGRGRDGPRSPAHALVLARRLRRAAGRRAHRDRRSGPEFCASRRPAPGCCRPRRAHRRPRPHPHRPRRARRSSDGGAACPDGQAVAEGAAGLVLRSGADPRLRRRPRRVEGTASWNKVADNRAWLLVLPVFALVAFSALVPLMTVVNYRSRTRSGTTQFFWNGVGWFHELLDPSTELGGRFFDALWRNLALLGDRAGDRDPARHRGRAVHAARGWGVAFCLVVLALPLLIPWNVVGTIWQVFARGDIGLLGWTREPARASTTTTSPTRSRPGSPSSSWTSGTGRASSRCSATPG